MRKTTAKHSPRKTVNTLVHIVAALIVELPAPKRTRWRAMLKKVSR